MRTLLHLSLLFAVSALVWRGSIGQLGQYESCSIDDYQSILISPTLPNGNYHYVSLLGACGRMRPGSSQRLVEQLKPDFDTPLYVSFLDEERQVSQIKNRFNAAPFCLAFTTDTDDGKSVLLRRDDGEPLLTVGPTIEFSLNSSTVSFEAVYIESIPGRLQICANGTHATYYIDCIAVETKPFVLPPESEGIDSLSIYGEFNRTSFQIEQEGIYSGGVEQLYSIQCEDQQVDLDVISRVQCRSVPTNADKSGTGCSEPTNLNISAVFTETILELPQPPSENDIYPFCEIIAWRNSPNVSINDIRRTDIRLYNPDTDKEVIRHITSYESFYLLRDDDLCFMQGNSIAQIRLMLSTSGFENVGPFSNHVSIECPPPETPTVYLELRGEMLASNSVLNITEIGEGKDALLCKTNKAKCCKGTSTAPGQGQFYYPNGIAVPIARQRHGFYRNRANQMVRLNRRIAENVYGPTGTFCCKVQDTCEFEQSVCVNLVF